MDQNQQKNIYQDLYKNINPQKGNENDSEKNNNQIIKKEKYWLKGAKYGLIFSIFVIILIGPLIAGLDAILYPCHGDMCGFGSIIILVLVALFSPLVFILIGTLFFQIFKEKSFKILKRIGIGLAGLIVLLFLAYLVKVNFGATKDALKYCEPQMRNGYKIGPDRTSCKLSIILGSSLCNFGNNEFKRDCLKFNAVGYMESKLCARQNAIACESPGNCIYNCYSDFLDELSKENKIDTSFCEKFVGSALEQQLSGGSIDYDPKRICYSMAAAKAKDINICSQLTSTIDKDNCFSNYGQENMDFSACDKISDASIKGDCQMLTAARSGDSSNCDRISEQEKRSTCYWNYFLVKKNDLSKNDCDKHLVGLAKSLCYQGVAQNTGQCNLCGLDSDEQEKGLCYVSCAEKSGDVKWCDSSFSDYYKDACFDNFVDKTNDPSLCEKFIETKKREGCYWTLATRLKRTDLCNKISDPYYQHTCETKILEK